MGKHNETGLKGEQIAVKHLQNLGYEIVCCNWRSGHKELDCIARKDGVYVFVEIKTRRNFNFGFPEEAVGEKKKQLMKLAAEAYLNDVKEFSGVRFDIISILLQGSEVKELRHIEDAFY